MVCFKVWVVGVLLFFNLDCVQGCNVVVMVVFIEGDLIGFGVKLWFVIVGVLYNVYVYGVLVGFGGVFVGLMFVSVVVFFVVMVMLCMMGDCLVMGFGSLFEDGM